MNKLGKKIVSFALIMVLGASMVACGNSNKSEENKDNTSGTAISGTYEGKGAGKIGDVKVSVTLDNGKITEVKVTEQNETESIAKPAIEQIPAAITEHQSLKVDAVTGATVTSNAIVEGVKAALTEAGATVADYEKEVTAQAGETIEETADIVVVGAGAAGLMAALEATEKGASVIILEKASSATASNFAMCGGPAAVETKIQETENAVVTRDQLFDALYGFANGTVNAKALKESVIGSGIAVNKLDELGLEMFLWGDPYNVGYRARHFIVSGGNDRIDPIVNKIEAQGGKFYYGTPGEKIIMENGKAVGVQAKKADGTILNVKAKAVFMATGGFLGSQEKVKEYFGDINLVSLGSNLSTGDGIDMVLEAGGTLGSNFAVLGNEFAGATSKLEGNTFTPDWHLANDNLIHWITGGLLVNQSGDRFINEKLVADAPLATGGEALLKVGKAYAIIDQAAYEANYKTGMYEYLGKPENWTSGHELMQTDASKEAEHLESAIKEGWGFKADTIKELAEHFNLANLEETVANYNELCKVGTDTEFGKASNFMKEIGKGPYYIFEYEPSAWGTNAGVKVDNRLNALTPDNKPIEGLYVGGVDAGNLYSSPYYNSPGTSVGIALGSGVYAAEVMLDYINK